MANMDGFETEVVVASKRAEQTPEKIQAQILQQNKSLSVTIGDKNALYAAYMPFLKKGGLFVATNKEFQVGDKVFILLNLMDELEKMPVEGKVVWITPKGAQSNRRAGIGVQFADKSEMVRNKIEVYLAGMLNAERTNHTM